MPTSRLRQICRRGLGIACIIGLSACGTAERPANAPGQPGAQAATIAALPTAMPATIVTVEPPTSALALPTVPTTPPPTVAPKETSMADKKPTQPPTARPTLQVDATLVPEGAAPANTPVGVAPTLAIAPTAPVELARADLARRRAVAPEEIRVVEVRDVIWPDAGLGCPQPGMAYKQVPVDGLLIRLESGGQVFEYHSGGHRAPFLCEQPARP